MERTRWLWLTSSLGVLLAIQGACGSDKKPLPDASPDAPVEPDGAAPDAAGDAVSDAGSDAATDADGATSTTLTATISDRRQVSVQLTWLAPSDGGARVSGYRVRFAKVPITAANFDDTTVTTDFPYSTTPADPGTEDGILVEKLYVETDYYFAVQGLGSTGNAVGALLATSAPTRSRFNVTVLTSPAGTNQLFGATLDGSGDVNGDGLSDLLVGTSNDTHAYLFLGGATFAPSAPSVTFTGANSFFGATVSHIGDIDKDGLGDIAIADSTGNRVLIYRGRMTWPATLTDSAADASYVITTDATWTGSGFGFSMARLGDFDGDGTDDFAIGAPGFNGLVGRIAVIYGRTGFTSFALPDTTRSLEIGGDPALNRTQFGLATVGLGHFYTATSGTTLVVSAPGVGAATSTSDNEGRLYAFHGRGPGAAIVATAADNALVGPGRAARIGEVLVNLGALLGTSPSLGSGNTTDVVSVPGMSGSAYLFSGTPATGPFASKLIAYQNAGSAAGQVIFGGGLSGRDSAISMIGGDTKGDFGMTSLQSTTVDIVDGAKLASLTSPADTRVAADVHVPMPTGWVGTALTATSLIPDINGDGYPEFAMGDQFGVVAGRVAVFW